MAVGTDEAERAATDAAEEERAALPAIPERNGMHLGTPAYEKFSVQMRELIKLSIMPLEATDADLYYLLEMSATYRLDPFAREIWAVKMPGKNAGKSGVVIMVGRDGLLSIAERNPDFRGFRCEAYYEADDLEYLAEPVEQPSGQWTHVRHSFSINKDRGKLMGAWAEVYREGRPPIFFNAKLEEYKKGGEYSPWQKQETVMIEKCALATALRLAYRISGLYLADEMTNLALGTAEEVRQQPVTAGLDLGEDPLVAAWLSSLLAALEQAKPNDYLPGKQRLLLVGLDASQREELAARLQAELYETTAELIERPTGEDEPAEVVEDAELVEDAPV